MHISLNNLGKRYRFEWIFKGITLDLRMGKSYAVLGFNGSGKSTFLKILSGHLSPSKGTIQFTENGKVVEKDEIYQYISYTAPYIELIEEFTLLEALRFHQRFKPLFSELTTEQLIQLLQLSTSSNKEIRFFSSGMKQRVKLALAICSDTPILLLDEPTTNLDSAGIIWYENLIQRFGSNRLIVVASNVETDYAFCQERIDITQYKKRSTMMKKLD